jgi:hexosaminidase
MRSHPDNYFLTDWKKHFQNIKTFIPAARESGYTGMIMTSWSTSGQYSTLKESETDIVDLYAIRHVYPVSAFNILLGAYAEALKSPKPLDIEAYVNSYGAAQYGFTVDQSVKFWNALTAAPYEIEQGVVLSPHAMTINAMLDTAKAAASLLADLQPSKNIDEFEQYRLMAAIRIQYISYEAIEAIANSSQFNKSKIPELLVKLKSLLDESLHLDKAFSALNQPFFYPGVLKEENELRNVKIRIFYEKLSGGKNE